MGTAREMEPLSEERLAALENNFYLSESDKSKSYRRGYMSLELGERHDLDGGYPHLTFMRDGEYCGLAAVEPVPEDPDGYERDRPLSLNEILTFVKVARHVAPESHMTAALADEARKFLIANREELLGKLTAVNDVLEYVSPK